MPVYRITAPAQHAAKPSRKYPDGKPALPAVDEELRCGKHRVWYFANQLAGPHRKATVTLAGRRQFFSLSEVLKIPRL